MTIFSTVMFILAIAMLIPALLLFNGSTGWLHSFEKGKYKDKRAYARLLGKAVLGIALSFAVSGLVALVNNIPTVIPLLIMIVGMIITMVLSCKKAKKYYK